MPIDTVVASHHSATWTDTPGRGYLLTSTQHTFPQRSQVTPAPSPPHLPASHPAFGPSDLRLPVHGQEQLPAPALPQVSTFTPQQSQMPPQTLSAQCQCWLHPTHSQGPGLGTHPSHQTAAVPPSLQGIHRILSLHPQVPWACTSHSSS